MVFGSADGVEIECKTCGERFVSRRLKDTECGECRYDE